MDPFDDYGPSMMLPPPRYDELGHLQAELEQEKRYR